MFISYNTALRKIWYFNMKLICIMHSYWIELPIREQLMQTLVCLVKWVEKEHVDTHFEALVVVMWKQIIT